MDMEKLDFVKVLGWFGFGKFPLKTSNFSFGSKKISSGRVGSKSTWVKGGSASYLLLVKSMLGLGQGPSLSPGRLSLIVVCNEEALFVYDDMILS